MKHFFAYLIFFVNFNFAFGAPISKAFLQKLVDVHSINISKSEDMQNHRFSPLSNGTIAYSGEGKIVQLNTTEVYRCLYILDVVSKGQSTTWIKLSTYPSLYVRLNKMKDVDALISLEKEKQQKQDALKKASKPIIIQDSIIDFFKFLVPFSFTCLVIYMFFKGLFSSRRSSSSISSSSAVSNSSSTIVSEKPNKNEWKYVNGSIRNGEVDITGSFTDSTTGESFMRSGSNWKRR